MDDCEDARWCARDSRAQIIGSTPFIHVKSKQLPKDFFLAEFNFESLVGTRTQNERS